jgi:hypothetical protein
MFFDVMHYLLRPRGVLYVKLIVLLHVTFGVTFTMSFTTSYVAVFTLFQLFYCSC